MLYKCTSRRDVYYLNGIVTQWFSSACYRTEGIYIIRNGFSAQKADQEEKWHHRAKEKKRKEIRQSELRLQTIYMAASGKMNMMGTGRLCRKDLAIQLIAQSKLMYFCKLVIVKRIKEGIDLHCICISRFICRGAFN